MIINNSLVKTCENPKFFRWALRKCTYDPEVVDQFLLYFPYVILFVAVLLFIVEKFFIKMFKVQDEAENFYDLFVKMSVLKGKKDEETSSKLVKPSIKVNSFFLSLEHFWNLKLFLWQPWFNFRFIDL